MNFNLLLGVITNYYNLKLSFIGFFLELITQFIQIFLVECFE